MVLLEDKSKVLLAPMIFFDEGFERRFKVGRKNEKYKIIFWNILEIVSNLLRAKREKSNEAEETLLIDDEEV